MQTKTTLGKEIKITNDYGKMIIYYHHGRIVMCEYNEPFNFEYNDPQYYLDDLILKTRKFATHMAYIKH